MFLWKKIKKKHKNVVYYYGFKQDECVTRTIFLYSSQNSM